MRETLILAGDIGGTHSRFSLCAVEGEAVRTVRTQVYASRSAPGLESLVQTFLAAGPKARIDAAALAVAGPVVEGRCVATNLPWVLDEALLGEAAGSPRTRLLNDLQAAAFGILFVDPDQKVSLNDLAPKPHGNAAVIAAGTGLGQAYLFWDGARHHPSPSEGSHGELGPRNETQLALSRYLIERFGHPSTERVVSGPGFTVLYDFLRDTGRQKAPPELEAELATGDKNALVSGYGVTGRYPICAEAMALFVDAFGAEAGNMALRGFATAGVYVAGGVPPKILPCLRDGRFMEAFVDKGRFKDFLSTIPVTVVLDEHAGLLGSAHFARMML